INDQGTQIVANFVDSNFERHGFALSDGTFSTVDDPGGTFDNSVNHTNNRGQTHFTRGIPMSRSRIRTPMVIGTVMAAFAASVGITAHEGGTPVAANRRTLFVDDDRQQCPKADYTSITAAIIAAAPG